MPQSLFDYVVEVVGHAAGLEGYRLTHVPAQLRHFTATFEPLTRLAAVR